MVSTVLQDDSSSIKTTDDDEDATDDENDTLLENALSTSIALASIFSTPKEHIADVRKAARQVGLHTTLMRRPGARTDGKSSFDQYGHRENSWWVVMGRNAEAVKHLMNLQQGTLPGAYPIDQDVENEPVPHPGASTSASMSLGFLQLVLAGAIGGAAVVFGMAVRAL